MSNIIPPLLSSTPPPIGAIEDDEDEFGDFMAPSDLSYGCDALSIPSTPQDTPVKQKTTPVDINSNNKDYQDKRKNVYSAEEPPDVEDVDDEEDFSDFSTFAQAEPAQSEPEQPEAVVNSIISEKDAVVCASLSEGEGVVVVEASEGIGAASEGIVATSESIVTKVNGNYDCEDSNVDEKASSSEDEFGDFTTAEAEHNVPKTKTNDIEVPKSPVEFPSVESESVFQTPEHINYVSNLSSEESSLNYSSATATSEEIVNKESYVCENETHSIEDDVVAKNADDDFDDDFGDFVTPEQSTQQSENAFEANFDSMPSHEDASGSTTFDFTSPKDGFKKAEEIVKSMFKAESEQSDDFCNADCTLEDGVFSEIKDVTDTNALTYVWSKSQTQKELLKALNIDTRNILYGPGLNTSMPKFAANLGLAPLEPIRSETLTPTTSSAPQLLTPSISGNSGPPLTDVPTAQFDWKESGLANPLDSQASGTILLDLEQLVASLDISPPPEAPDCGTTGDGGGGDLALDDWNLWLQSVSKDEKEDPKTDDGTKKGKTYDSESVNSLQFAEVLRTEEDEAGEGVSQEEDADFSDFTSYQGNDDRIATTADDFGLKALNDLSTKPTDDSGVKVSNDFGFKVPNGFDVKALNDFGKLNDFSVKAGLNDFVVKPLNNSSINDVTVSSSDGVKASSSYGVKTSSGYGVKAPSSYDIKAASSNEVKASSSYDVKASNDFNSKSQSDFSTELQNNTELPNNFSAKSHFNMKLPNDFSTYTSNDFNSKSMNDFNAKSMNDFNAKSMNDFNAKSMNDFNAKSMNDFNTKSMHDFNSKSTNDFNSKSTNDFVIKSSSDFSIKSSNVDFSTKSPNADFSINSSNVDFTPYQGDDKIRSGNTNDFSIETINDFGFKGSKTDDFNTKGSKTDDFNTNFKTSEGTKYKLDDFSIKTNVLSNKSTNDFSFKTQETFETDDFVFQTYEGTKSHSFQGDNFDCAKSVFGGAKLDDSSFQPKGNEGVKIDFISKITVAKNYDPIEEIKPSGDLLAASFNLQSTENDFAGFQDFTKNTILLRETHINNTKTDADVPGWLKPTILTPVMDRKLNVNDDDDDFSDFQMSLPPDKSLPALTVLPITLQPTQMQPLKPPEPAINWPEPGITEEELQRFEIYSKAPKTIEHKLSGNTGSLLVEKSVVVPANKVVLPSKEVLLPPNNKVVISKDLVLPILDSSPRKYSPGKKPDDDEWTDFISNTKTRTATPELPLSIPQLSSIQPPKLPIPVITPQGLMQTKIPSAPQAKPIPSQPPLSIAPSQDGYQPSIISQQYAQQMYQTTTIPSVVKDDGDEWSDFVSSRPVNGSTRPRNGGMPMPELEFAAPRGRAVFGKK